MASILLGCSSFVYAKLSSSRRDRLAREAEYSSQFEELKAQNAERVRKMSSTRDEYYGTGGVDGETGMGRGKEREGLERAPPSYEDVERERRGSGESVASV